MARKVLSIIIIILACAVLFVVGCAVIMFLAPGVEIFGIRYVAPNQDDSYYRKLSDPFGGNVIIESVEVPVEISYEWQLDRVEIEYRQEFIGFTTTPRTDQRIEQYVEGGDLYIKAHDLKAFIYANKTDKDGEYLKVRLPQSFVGRKISVVSETSSVKYNAAGSSKQSEIEIDTKGSVSFEGAVNADMLTIVTKQELTLESNISVGVLNIKGGTYNININSQIASTLNIETGNGSLILGSANNVVNFKSTSGSLKAKDGEKLSITKANIETYSGNVHIDEISGSETTTIKTKVGSINIGKAKKLSIENPRSAITVGSVEDCNILGGIGVVTVEEVTNALAVETKSGYIYLGTTEKIVNNPTAKATTGKVFARNVSGVVKLTSTHSDIEMTGNNVTSVNIESGGGFVGSGILGKIDIVADGDVDVQVDKITDDINITTKDRCKNVVLTFATNSITDFNYNFSSTKSRYAYVYKESTKLFEESSLIKSETIDNNLKTVTIKTSYADMYVYTK